jgi:hypothetical protein
VHVHVVLLPAYAYLRFPVARSSSSFLRSGPSDGAESAGVTECFVEQKFCRLMHSSPNSPSNSLSYTAQSPVSSVVIATGYGLDGRGSIHGRSKIFLFSTTSRLALRPTQPLI